MRCFWTLLPSRLNVIILAMALGSECAPALHGRTRRYCLGVTVCKHREQGRDLHGSWRGAMGNAFWCNKMGKTQKPAYIILHVIRCLFHPPWLRKPSEAGVRSPHHRSCVAHGQWLRALLTAPFAWADRLRPSVHNPGLACFAAAHPLLCRSPSSQHRRCHITSCIVGVTLHLPTVSVAPAQATFHDTPSEQRSTIQAWAKSGVLRVSSRRCCSRWHP